MSQQMTANNLQIEDNSGLVNGNQLSLLSIASTLRRDSQSDEEKTLNMNIEETVAKMSHLSLKSQSEALSAIGNKYANCGHNWEAIRYYSKAISLYDEDYRLYCNRSFCYEKLLKFEDSLADALRSVILMPTRPKPYFRQGKALIGLKRYLDAEKAFNKILQITGDCEDTKKELLKTRYLALRDQGLNVEDASIAAINHKSVKEAIEATVGKLMPKNKSEGDSKDYITYDYLNDTKPFVKSHENNDRHKPFLTMKTTNGFNSSFNGFQRLPQNRSQSRPPNRMSQFYGNTNQINASNGFVAKPIQKRSTSVDNIFRYKKNEQMFQRSDVKRFREYRLPKNLFGYKGLWIGNVSPNCKVTQLRAIFGRFGPIDYVNVVSHSFCAFVNYQNLNSPRIAIANLYGQIIPGVSNGERPLVFRFIPSNDQKDLHFMRPYQPKGTNECYFWRTTGCKDWNCPLVHYPICRGIDFQPWMKNRNKRLY